MKNKSLKRKLFLISIMLITGLNPMCSDDSTSSSSSYSCSSCVTSPEAVASCDSTNCGVYKGTITGSNRSGTFAAYLKNGDSTIQLKYTLGNKISVKVQPSGAFSNMIEPKILFNTVSSEQTITGTETTTNTFSFSDTTNSNSFSITINATTGAITSVTMTPGDGTAVTVNGYKESSTALVQAWEGTWSNLKDNGVWNNYTSADGSMSGTFVGSVITSGTLTGTYTSSTSSVTITASGTGTVSGTGYSCSLTYSGGGTATISGDTVTYSESASSTTGAPCSTSESLTTTVNGYRTR